MKFEVSVIIPVYNANPFIEKAVESVLPLQQVKQIILVDDGSVDGSYETCKNLEERHESIQFVIHSKHANKGASASRNLGLEKATSNYIAFLDADDLYLPERFTQTELTFKNNPDAFGVYEAIGVKYYSEKARNKFLEIYKTDITTVAEAVEPKALFECLTTRYNFGWFHLDGLTIKNKTYKFDENLRQCQDTDFIYALCIHEVLLAGNITSPVAPRGVHDHNRVLYHAQEKEDAYRIFVEKWYRIMLESNFSAEVNKKFLKEKISQQVNYNRSKFSIKLQLIISFILLLSKSPRHIIKILSTLF